MAASEITGDGLGAPAVEWFSITPDDDDFLTVRPRAIYVGVSGNVAVQSLNGTSVTFLSMAVGWHPLRPVKVLATGTTATDLIGVY